MKFIITLMFLISSAFAQIPNSVLFYYSNRPLSNEQLNRFDWIVIDPDADEVLKDIKEQFWMKNKPKIIGYLSIGEVEKEEETKFKNCILGKNKEWNSLIIDLRNNRCFNLLIRKAKNIAKKGFDGFFLDTIDSYQRILEKKNWEEYEKKEIELIKKLRQLYPKKLILINRGFRIFDKVKKEINGFVVEDLFYTQDKNGKLVRIPSQETKMLTKKLQEIKTSGIPVIVIDYIPLKLKNIIAKDISQIRELGFIPYISERKLNVVGYSFTDFVPRKIIITYDSSDKYSKIRQDTMANRILQLPVEYLGFKPEIYDINKEKLPPPLPSEGYRGVIVSITNKHSKKFIKWLIRAKNNGLKIFFCDFPLETTREFKRFGLNIRQTVPDLRFKIVKKVEGFGFEKPLKPKIPSFLIESGSSIKKPLVVEETNSGIRHIPMAITTWGGYAVDEVLLDLENGLWSYNPFKLFKEIFKPQFPAPDTTTENGNRLLIAHIDGDAFFGVADFDTNKHLGEVLRDEILKNFQIPHGVSVIEGEIAPWGLYPKESKKLMEIARNIFSLKNVEMASHTFSHPFEWQGLTKKDYKTYKYSLPIKGYVFNPEREIKGSVEFTNKYLSPDGKKKTKDLFWSGNCDPDWKDVELTYKTGVYNINGGDTIITYEEPFLRNVAPSGVNFGNFYQVYAPISNEMYYTNWWHGPYWGFIRVIQTFKLTDKPRRLKPIGIYYHFYSCQKIASLNALKKVYRYALSQDVLPIFPSEYAQIVLDARNTVIYRKNRNTFLIKNQGYCRTVRIPKSWGIPDIAKSSGVVGYREINGQYYIHLSGSGNYKLVLTNHKPSFRLINSNGRIVKWKKQEDGKKVDFLLGIRSYQIPTKVRVETTCKIKVLKGSLSSKLGNVFEYTGKGTVEIKATCSK